MTRSIFLQKTPHASHNRASYGMYFVDPATDWCSVLAAVIICVISYNIGTRYGGTRLYLLVVLVLSVIYDISLCMSCTCYMYRRAVFFFGWRRPVLLWRLHVVTCYNVQAYTNISIAVYCQTLSGAQVRYFCPWSINSPQHRCSCTPPYYFSYHIYLFFPLPSCVYTNECQYSNNLQPFTKKQPKWFEGRYTVFLSDHVATLPHDV